MKRFAGIILAVLLMSVLAAGCSGKEENGSTTPGTASPTGSEADGGGKPASDPITVKIMTEQSNPPIVTDAPIFKYIAEKTNVTVELEPVPAANYDQKAQTLIATDNLPDVMRIRNGKSYLADAAKNGLLVPISDYTNLIPNLSKLMNEDEDIRKGMVSGKLYGFPLLGEWKLQLAQAPMIRMDLVEKLGLKKPETFEELYQVLQKFKEAYPDKIPFTNRQGASNLLTPIAFSMGSGWKIYYDPDVDGGKYLYGPAHEEFKAPLEFLHRLYAEKLLDPDYAINTGDAMTEKLSSGKALFYFDNNSFGANYNKALQQTDPDARFDLIPPMENSLGQRRNPMYKKDWLHQFVISANAKNKEDIIKFMDWMYSDEGTLITNYGIEGENYKMENGEPVVLDSMIEKYKNESDPFRSMQNALGIGFQTFSLNVDEHPMAQMADPALREWSEQFTTDNGYVYEVTPPPLSDEEIEQLKTLQSKVETLLDQEIDKFIIGTRPMSEYDDFIRQLNDSGAQQIEDIYNAAQARFENKS